MQSLRIDTNIGGGDSGYTSLPPANSFFETALPSEQSFNSLPATTTLENHQSPDPLYTYNHDISNLALANMNLVKFNDLCRISEEGDALSTAAHSKYHQNGKNIPGATSIMQIKQSKSDLAYQLMSNETEAKLQPILDASSVASEQVSVTCLCTYIILQYVFKLLGVHLG